MKKFISLLFALFLFLHYYAVQGKIVELQLLFTSDIHGNLCDEKSGLFYLDDLLNKIRKSDSLLMDCGDFLQGSFEANQTEGRLIIKAFNLLKYDFFVPGNHEFEFGETAFLTNMAQLETTVLGANIVGVKSILPYKIINKKQLKIAVIGLTERFASYRVLPDTGLKFLDEEEALACALTEIHRERPDIIILLRHGSIYFRGGTLYKMLAKFPEIDLVAGGHSHEIHGGDKVAGAYFLQSDAHCRNLIECTIFYDDEKKQLLKISSKVHALSEYDLCISPKFAAIKNERQTLLAAAAKKLPLELPDKISVNDLRRRLVIEGLKKAFPDGDVFLYTASDEPQIFSGTLNPLSIYKLFPYENHPVQVEVDRLRLIKIIDSLQSLNNKYHAKLIVYPDLKNLTGKTVKLVTADYLLSGAGSNNSGLRKLSGNQKILRCPVSLRQLLSGI